MPTSISSQRGFTWTELAVLLTIALVLVRYIWAAELLQFEDQLIVSLGFEPAAKYFVTVPLFLVGLLYLYRREQQQLTGTGTSVVRPSVVVFAVVALFAAFLYLFLVVSGRYA